jgi:hypothetical protein
MNMRPFAKPYLLCAAALLLAQPAWAVDDGTREAPPVEDETDESVTYSGIGLSYVGTDFDNVDDAINLGVVIGFRIPTVNIFAVELELSTTVIPGQIDSQSCSTSGGGGGFPIIGGGSSPQTTCVRSQNDFGTNSAGVYAVLRSPGRFYAMGKVPAMSPRQSRSWMTSVAAARTPAASATAGIHARTTASSCSTTSSPTAST